MRHHFASLVAVVAAAVAFPHAATADFNITSGTLHVSGSAVDGSGSDGFNTSDPLNTGIDTLSDLAITPGMLTESHADVTSNITPGSILVIGGVFGHTSASMGGPVIDALAEITINFNVSNSKQVLWEYSTDAGQAGEFSTVELTGPGGIVNQGTVTLAPGDYTIVAMAGYSALQLTAGQNVSADFTLTLTNVPTPGALALLATGAVAARARRRR